MKKLGLALGAGGARGVAHVGFLQALDENGIKPDFISGSSMGSVVGACYAIGMKPNEMMRHVLKLHTRDLIDFSPTAFKAGSILKSKKLSQTLGFYLRGKQFEDLKIPFSCTGVDVLSGKEVLFTKGDLRPAVVASSSIPLIFQPVEVDEMLVCDGGVLCRVPIKHAKAMGADVVIGLDVLGPLSELEELKSVPKYFLRLIDIYDTKITSTEVEQQKPDLYLCPDLGDMSQYKIDTEKFLFAYKQGYKIAMDNMDTIKSLLK